MIRIGTRGSALARWQAEWVRSRLGPDTELVVISTTGDQITDKPLQESEGIGFFTKELEDALLAGTVDVAVHSLKDLPTKLAAGLVLGAVPVRGEVEDLLLINRDHHDPLSPTGCAAGTRVGTSSNRRQFQLQLLQPDLQIAVIRGNVPTRVAKVQSGEYGAVVMAKAAVERLGDALELGDLIVHELAIEEMLPAPGQGALGIECRENDAATREALAAIHDPHVDALVTLERDLLSALGGGCNAPLGAHATTDPLGGLALEAIYFTPDAKRHVRTRIVGPDPAFLLRAAIHDMTPLTEALPASGPLSGLTILNTRPRGRAQQLTRALLMAGASVWVQPAIQTVTRQLSSLEIGWVRTAKDYDLAIITSPAAVEHLCDAMGWDGRLGVAAPAVVVTMGQGTTESVEEAGWKVYGSPRRGNTDSLLDYLDHHELMNPGCRVLYLRAEEGRDQVPEALTEEAAMEVDLVLPYRTLPAAHPPLPPQPKVDVITFTSPSAVESFLEINEWREGWVALAIGPTTADACTDAGLRPLITADDPTPAGLVKALTGYVRAAR